MPRMNGNQKLKTMKTWHKIVVERANSACEECGHSAPFDSGELCGDHVQTQGARPDLRYDVTNGRCVCLPCHNKRHNRGLPAKEPTVPSKVKKLMVCEIGSCPIYALGSGKKPKRCWKHQ
jgi:hypothetical protein